MTLLISLSPHNSRVQPENLITNSVEGLNQLKRSEGAISSEIIVQAAKTRVILAIVMPKLYIARPVISLTAKKRFISFPFASKISQFGGINDLIISLLMAY